MKKEIIINSTNEDTRIALLENNKLVELFVERPDNERSVGNIYKGKVRKVVKGMQAAFINLGDPQDAFLHFSDMGANNQQLFANFDDEDGENGSNGHAEKPPEKEKGNQRGRRDNRRRGGRQRSDAWQLLKNGQDVLVQIIKEPIANKGPRVTTELTVPGRFLVLVPNQNRIGVSRKISSGKERRRLRQITRKHLPSGFGLIVRTVAEGKSEDLIKQDLLKLLKEWKSVQEQMKSAAPFSLLFQDLGMASSIIRDLFTDDVERVVIDSRRMFRDNINYLKEVGSELHKRVEYYRKRKPIFDAFNIEADIQNSIQKKVWMANGGYIIVEHTEALTVVDVNSGRFFGKKNHEKNSLKVNLESAREIARQLRLRDVGGLIVIDFIDMEEEANRKRVINELHKEFSRDRSVSKIDNNVSRFGLVQMTRQRIRPSLIYNITEPCEFCEGSGLVPTKGTVVAGIERAIRRYVASRRLDRRVILQVHPEMYTYLNNEKFGRKFQLMWKYWVKILTEENEELRSHEFKLFSKRGRKDVTKQFAS